MGGVVIALRLAETLSAIGNWEEAITYYEEGLEEQKDIHSLFGYAFTLYQGEEYQRSIGAWKELKELDPEYASLYCIWLNVMKKKECFKKAMKHFMKELKLMNYLCLFMQNLQILQRR